MNASKPTLLRALRGLGYTALLLTVFEACSNDEGSGPPPPPGPASLAITGIDLGQGLMDGSGASSIVACDYKIGVKVKFSNWTLRGPGWCAGALQCGQLRVSLFDVDGTPMLSQVLSQLAAGNGVALNVRPLLSATPPQLKRTYTVKVELVDDAGQAYVALDGGNGSAEEQFDMALPDPADCPPGSAGAGDAGTGTSSAGAGGDSAGGDSAGAGGDSAGAGGDSAGAGGDSAADDSDGGGGDSAGAEESAASQ